MRNEEEMAALKRHIRGRLNMAAVRGHIDGLDALAILQSISAEFVARIQCDHYRQECVDTVIQAFPLYVEGERMTMKGMVRQ